MLKKTVIHSLIIYHRLTSLELEEDLSLCIFNHVITKYCFLAENQDYHIKKTDSTLATSKSLSEPERNSQKRENNDRLKQEQKGTTFSIFFYE